MKTFRVSESRPKDVGRGIARINPRYMAQIGAEVGDSVQVEEKRKTAAKITPAYMEDRGKGIIRMDGLIRENAQVGLDEKVSVHKVPHNPSKKTTLSPLTLMRTTQRDWYT